MIALEARDLESGYGDVQILWGVSLKLEQGQLTTLVGTNGSGKTTLLRTMTGLIAPWKGSVSYQGRPITALSPHEKAQLGIVMVPEGRQLFTDMTVLENLELGATPGHARSQYRQTLEWIFQLFPRLQDRSRQIAGTMSGGEQQMLAVGRGLMLRPRLLMLDEPSLGLAPVVTDATFAKIQEVHAMGTAILLVEQNVSRALSMVQRAYVLESGKVIIQGSSAELANNKQVQVAYLGM